MAVEGEWAWPRCIGCGKDMPRRRPKDYRYGMDVCCAKCMESLWRGDAGYLIYWAVRNAQYTLDHYKKSEDRDEPIPPREWADLAKKYALAWARLRDHFQKPPFPAGLELFMVEIHNVRNLHNSTR